MFSVVCSNTSYFPGQSGVPTLPQTDPVDGAMDNIYGNVNGVVAFNFSLTQNSSSSDTITINNVNVTSIPEMYDVVKISNNNHRVVMNDFKIFPDEEYFYAIFDENGDVIELKTDQTISDDDVYALYRYKEPSQKIVVAPFTMTVSYTSTNSENTGTSGTVSFTSNQSLFWNRELSIQQFVEKLNSGEY